MQAPSPADVRQLRESLGLTQKEIGQMIGRSGADWYRYESGRRTMDAAVWSLLLLATGKHPAAIAFKR